MAKPVLFLLVLLMVLTGCSIQPAATSNPPDGSEGNVPATGSTPTASARVEGFGYSELVSALSELGATVEPAGSVDQVFFSVPGNVIRVNGNDVQVFAYDSEEARQAESSQISSDGSSIGTNMVTWIDQPNFWAEGQLIVLYLGSDQETLSQITQVMGSPITQ